MDGFSDIFASLGLSLWYYVLAAMIVTLLLVLINSIRYKILLEYLDEKISVSNAFLIHCIVKFSIFITPLKMGAILTKPLATRILGKIPIKKSFPAILFEQFFDLGWQVLFLPFLLIAVGEEKLVNDLKLKFLIFVLLVFSMLLLFKNYSAFVTFIWKFKRFLPRNIKRKGKEMELTEENAKMLINKYMKYFSEWRFVSKVSLPTLIVVLASPVILQLSAMVFSVAMTYKTAFVIFWASTIIGRVSGLPGGFGSQDITMIGLFSVFGIGPAVALKITLIYRFIIMAPIMAIGGPLFFYLGKKVALKEY